MILYLMRHGQAAAPETWAGPDETRPLTPRGRRELAGVAQEWARLAFRPAKVFASPLVRAQQTAEIVSAALPGPGFETRPELTAGRPNAPLRALLRRLEPSSTCLLIGHMPDLAVFGGKLTGDLRLLEEGLRPAELVAVELPAEAADWGAGRLLWRRRAGDWPAATDVR